MNVTARLVRKLTGLSLLYPRRSSGPVRRTVAESRFFTGCFPVMTLLVARKTMLVKIIVLEWNVM